MKRTLSLLLAGLLLAGCSSVSTHTDPAANLGALKRIFVEHRLAEERGIDRMIADELKRLGYDAAYGPLTMMPEKVDAILAYEDRWAWDFRSYLIELRVELRDLKQPPTRLAGARYFRPAIATSRTPEEMVRTTLAELFKESRTR
jgi:hypothetical protein